MRENHDFVVQVLSIYSLRLHAPHFLEPHDTLPCGLILIYFVECQSGDFPMQLCCDILTVTCFTACISLALSHVTLILCLSIIFKYHEPRLLLIIGIGQKIFKKIVEHMGKVASHASDLALNPDFYFMF